MKKSPKILIIDDEAPIRASLKEILEYENYQVMEAEDGAEGLKLATKFAFDVVFCDIKMPKMDGLEVLDALVEKGIDGRVIMISGHGTCLLYTSPSPRD